MYASAITDTNYASRVTTNVCLSYILTNFYSIAVIVVTVLVCKACCGIANATAVIATATTIAAIAKAVFLWFISQLFSTMLYLRCITTTANNREETVEIVELGSIH